MVTSWLRFMSGAGERIAALAVFAMLVIAALTVTDAVIRSAAGLTIPGLNEVTALLLCIAVAACMPAGLAKSVSLRIEFFDAARRPGLAAVLAAIGHAVLLIFIALVSWQLAVVAIGIARSGQTTMMLGWSQSPFIWAAAILFGAATVVQLLVTAASLSSLRRQCGRPGTIIAAVIVLTTIVVAVAFVGNLSELNRFLARYSPTNPVTLAILWFSVMWVGIVLSIPVAAVMAMAGVFGLAAMFGMTPALSVLGGETRKYLTNESLAVLPMFLMMGSFASVAGLSSDIYRLAQAIVGHVRGGLGHATIVGCAGFGALTGSSLATAATVGRVAMPEMRQRGYDVGFAAGTIAAGGTLGQLVPPSTALIVYGLLAEESIGRLFIAALVPALIAVVLYLAAIWITVRIRPKIAPSGPKQSVNEILTLTSRCWGVLLLFGVVVGGIYSGLLTETEAASMGALGAFLFALFRGRLNRDSLWSVMVEVTMTIAMIYALIIGAVIFSYFIGTTRLPEAAIALFRSLDLMPLAIVFALVVCYLLLGMVMESFAMMVITVPIFAPLVMSLGYSGIWWGIITVICVETGMITPPFGLNLFIIKSIDNSVPMTTIYRGVLPFCVADIVRVIILLLFPALVLWLPSTM